MSHPPAFASTQITHGSYLDLDALPSTELHLDTDGIPTLDEVVEEWGCAAACPPQALKGIPTLDEVVEDHIEDALVAHIKAQVLTELEPLLRDLVRTACAELQTRNGSCRSNVPATSMQGRWRSGGTLKASACAPFCQRGKPRIPE